MSSGKIFDKNASNLPNNCETFQRRLRFVRKYTFLGKKNEQERERERESERERLKSSQEDFEDFFIIKNLIS